MKREAHKTDSSNMRHLVQVESVTRTPNGRGGFTEAWSAVGGPVWASVSPIRASQLHEYRVINVEATHVLKFRGGTTINEKNRVRFGSRLFEVLTIEDIQERGVVLVVTCKERR